MAITFYNFDTDKKLKNKSIIRKLILSTIKEHKKLTGDINIIITSDSYLLSLNTKYLKRNYLTDIITFNYNDGNRVSGDLFISYERIKENAAKFKDSISRELLRVIIHGILHLLGFEDLKEAEINEMKKAEDLALKCIDEIAVIS